MRSKQQQIDAVLATREFLARLATKGSCGRVPGPVRIEAQALLAQYPVSEEFAAILEEHLQDARACEPPPGPSLTDMVRMRYRRTPLREEATEGDAVLDALVAEAAARRRWVRPR